MQIDLQFLITAHQENVKTFGTYIPGDEINDNDYSGFYDDFLATKSYYPELTALQYAQAIAPIYQMPIHIMLQIIS